MNDSKLIFRVNGCAYDLAHVAMMAAVEAGAFIGDVRPWFAGVIGTIEANRADRVSHDFKPRGVYGSPVAVEIEARFPTIGSDPEVFRDDPFALEADAPAQDKLGGWRVALILRRRACGTVSMLIQSPPIYSSKEHAEHATRVAIAHAEANDGRLPNLCDPLVAAAIDSEVAS